MQLNPPLKLIVYPHRIRRQRQKKVKMDPNSMGHSHNQQDFPDFLLESGPVFCVTTEECRARIIAAGINKFTPQAVARLLVSMINRQSQTGGTGPQQQGLWGDGGDSNSGSWNLKNFVQAILDIIPNFVWKEVFHHLDSPEFFVKDSHAFRSLVESLRFGLQLQGQTRPDQFPVEAFYRTWNNSAGQLSFIKFGISPFNFDIFCFADLPFQSCPVEVLKSAGDKSYDLKEVVMWKSMQLIELLLTLSEAGHYPSVQEMFQWPVLNCPDILILGLIQLNTPMTSLRSELLSKNLFPAFLGNHVNSGAILHQAWHAGAPTVRPIMMSAMAEWYLRSEFDQAKLSRLLDIAQDLKALQLLLNSNSHAFIIDLACLASRREFLKLDKWLNDKIREHGEPFVASLVNILNRRAPYLFGKEEYGSKAAQLPPEVLNIMIQCLHQCTGKVGTETNEGIQAVLSSFTMYMNKARQSPGLLGSTGAPPLGMRTHSRFELGFGLPPNPNPSSTQIFGGGPQVDPSMNLGGGPSNLNPNLGLGATGPGTGNFGVQPMNPIPGSPSRVLGPNFAPQNNLPQQQLGGPTIGSGAGAINSSSNTAFNTLIGGLVNTLGGRGNGNPNPIGTGHGLPPASQSSGPLGNIGIATGVGIGSIGIGPDSSVYSELQPTDISKEADDEANSYFHRIYSKPPDPCMSIDEVLELLKRFQESSVRREREVFSCMLRNLFEEYKFFPQYPEKELYTTAQLFGGIIEHGLVTTYLQLGVALRYVVDALKKPPGSKMYYFGLATLDRFRLKLKEYPQYCHYLTTIPHFQEFPPHLVEYVEYGAKSSEPPKPRSGAIPLPPALTPNPGSAPAQAQGSALPIGSAAPGQGKPGLGIIGKGGPSISGRPSIANSTNITTLLTASENTEKKVTAPPESVQDKTAFIFNNLNQMNLTDKCKELKEIMGSDSWPWVAQYLVMKRASIELNFHTLYSNLLDTLKESALNYAVLRETHRNIGILLRADKTPGNYSDRSLLKNLGHWLGMITVMKNRPIVMDDLDIKSLIIEASRKGIHDLLYVVPFAAKIMESCARSAIFKPPCPWTMAILNVLAELHKEPDMKLNLKFEVEVLCKGLAIEVNDLTPSNLLKEDSTFKITVRQLSHPPSQGQGDKAITPRPIQAPAPEAIQAPAKQSESSSGQSSSAMSSISKSSEENQPHLSNTPVPTASMAASFQQNHVMGPPVVGGLSSTTTVPGGIQEPKFSYMEVDTSDLPGLLSHVAINSNLPLFQAHPNLQQFIRPSVDKAIQDLLHPVVDRSIKYTINACESIIKKDFALEPEDEAMRIGAHHMMRYLTAGMAMITSRDHIFIAISGNLKAAFTGALRVMTGNEQQAKEMIETAVSVIAQDNMELACVFIQKTAVEKALIEIDKRLCSDYDARKQAKSENRRYFDPLMMTYQADRIPEQIRLKPTGGFNQQLSVYEDFSRNIPGFLSLPEGDVPFVIPKFSATVGGRIDAMGGNLNLPLSSSNAPPPSNALPQSSIPTTPNDDLESIYEKIIIEMDNYLQGLAMSHSPAAAQLASGVRSLADSILIAKSSRSVVAAITLLQKAVEGLLEGLAAFPNDPEIIRFRDAHLMVLKGLQDTRAFGQQWVTRQVTKSLIETRNELKFNVEAVDTLFRANLVNMLQFDPYVANAMEKGNNMMAVAFAMQIVQMYLVDERYSTGISESDLYHTVDMLARCATLNRQQPEGLVRLIEVLRNNHEGSNFVVDRAPGGTTSQAHSTPALSSREFDDPTGLVEKSELLLREWIRLYTTQGTPKDSNKPFTAFIHELNLSGILKSDEAITKFFRISVQCCVNQVYQGPHHAGNLNINRQKVYQSTDALVRLVALLVRHIGDNISTTPKINLLNKFLGIVAGLLVQDHEMQKEEFIQLPFHRLFIMLFYDLNASDPVLEAISMQILTGFSNTLHILNPSKVPGFAYAWLEIIGNRIFISKMLALASDQKCWAMYCQLLLDLFKFMMPFLRNTELPKAVQTIYRGTLRVLLVILHDFPDFLCDYCYHFLDAIPPNCIQMRNLILSAFPRNMRLPDPFTANLKFELLPDTAVAPRILSNVGAMITPASFKKDLDSYLKTRAPVTFLSELRTNLQMANEMGTRYNIPLLNALVLFVGSQHIAVIRGRNQTPNLSTIAHTSHMDIFQNLAVDLDTEGRYLFLNALANQLRFPSSHTHYFSLVILYLFAQSNTEVVQEQITRVLLERLVVNRPHPWGLLVTFIELIKNTTYNFWSHEFVHCAPEVEKLFESVARSCMVTKNVVMTSNIGVPPGAAGTSAGVMNLENTIDNLNLLGSD